MKVLKLLHTRMRVNDIEATVAFYQKALGLELARRHTSPRGAQLAFAVADTGVGIGAEERRHIFEPFYSTKPPGRGTGLGLAICREIAAALKGRIEVESVPGAGSAFTLRIPAEPTRGTPAPSSWPSS